MLRYAREGRWGWLLRNARNYWALKLGVRFGEGRAWNPPIMGGLVLTSRCNLKCRMCKVPDRPNLEMTLSDWTALADQMADCRVAGIAVTGGEPLLVPFVFDLVRHIRARGLACTFNSNGVLLGREGVIEALIEADPTNINISLDGADEAVHDRTRGVPGSFRKTVEGIRALTSRIRVLGRRIPVTLVTVLSHDNARDLQAIGALGRSLGAARWGVIPAHAVRGSHCRVEPDPALTGIAGALSACGRLIPLENSDAYCRLMDRAFRGDPLPVPCNAGYASLIVDGGRNVYPCWPFYETGRKALSLGTRTLRDVWNSPEFIRARLETLQCRDCYWNCHAELSLLIPITTRLTAPGSAFKERP